MYQLRIVLVCVLAFLCGCSAAQDDKWKSKRPKIVPARGVLRLNGKPLDGAQVVLVPTTGNHGGSALSSADGSFQLTSFPPDDGVVPGSYKVMVVKSDLPKNPDPDAPESTVPQHAKLLVPVKYTNPDTSDLTVEIPDSGRVDIALELND